MVAAARIQFVARRDLYLRRRRSYHLRCRRSSGPGEAASWDALSMWQAAGGGRQWILIDDSIHLSTNGGHCRERRHIAL